MAAGSKSLDRVIWFPNSSRLRPVSHPCKGICQWLATFRSALLISPHLFPLCNNCATHQRSYLTTRLRHCHDCLCCLVHNTLIQNSVGNGLWLLRASVLEAAGLDHNILVTCSLVLPEPS